MNSRKEMLERGRYDLGSMERALTEAKEGLEELEIRKTINDVSDEEYAAKAPGYKWDIAQYTDEVVKKKLEIKYLADIKKMFSGDEINDLIELGDECSSSLDAKYLAAFRTVAYSWRSDGFGRDIEGTFRR